MKTLYYVPMIHSPEELGSLGERVKQVHAKVHGNDGLENFLEKIADYWDEVCNRIIAAGLFSSKVSCLHIFVDGLPNTDENTVRKVVEDLIVLRIIPAYQIIARLRKYGAKVHGTEDTKLLLEEYAYFKGLLEGKSGDAEAAYARLIARDAAIALRIREVMTNDGDIGILFIGKLHDVIGKLPNEFTVVCL